MKNGMPGVLKLITDTKHQIKTYICANQIHKDLRSYISDKKSRINSSGYKDDFAKLEDNIYHKTIQIKDREASERDYWHETIYFVVCVIYSLTSGLPATIILDYHLDFIGPDKQKVTATLIWRKDKKDKKNLNTSKAKRELAKFLIDEKIEKKDVSIFFDFLLHAFLPEKCWPTLIPTWPAEESDSKDEKGQKDSRSSD